MNSNATRRRVAKRRNITITLVMLMIGACLLVGGVGGAVLFGVSQGNADVHGTRVARIRAETDLQYQQALIDIDEGHLERARARLWTVINLNPVYPGAREAFDRVTWLLQNPPTPTPSPTPMPTLAPSVVPPTPVIDPDEVYTQAQAAVGAQDWATAINLLDALSGAAPDYRASEVNAMRFNALVQLGLQRLNADRLEEGINLLDRAALYGPLPPLAESGRALAADYLQALSYWGADWDAAIKALRALYVTVPEYRDVQRRLFQAYAGYADALVRVGDYCPAVPLYASALGVIYDGQVESKRADVQVRCANATPIPSPTVEPTVIPGALGVTVFNQANLRQGPSQDFGVIEKLGPGALLSATGRNAAGDWLFCVAPSGAQGWVFIEVINTASVDVFTLPVIQAGGVWTGS